MPPDTPASTSDVRDLDDTLIRLCLDGDQAAWDRLVRVHWRRVFGVAYKFVGRHDEAEDLTQDIFLKVFKSLATFDRRANFQTWLVSVSRNLCIDHYRRLRQERAAVDRTVDTDTLAPAATTTGPIVALEQRDRVALLQRAFAALQPTLKTAVVMRDLQEMSYQEIADTLGVPEGTVKSRINRGRIELARAITRLQGDGEGDAPRAAPPRPGGR